MFIYFSVPKAQPLVYAQIPFYLTNLSATEAILETIKVGIYIQCSLISILLSFANTLKFMKMY